MSFFSFSRIPPSLRQATLWLVALGVALPMLAQEAGERPAPPFEKFTSEHGLPSDRILSLAQSDDGFLWVGTDRGLVRFDGRHWRIFDRSTHPTLGSEKIASLEPARGGFLWVGTLGGGLYRFDGAAFLPVSRPNQLGGPWNVSALLQQEDGLLWVGTPEDLLYLPNLANSLRYGLPGIPVSDLTIDPYGHVWASANRGLFRQVQLTFQSISLPLGVDPQPIYAVSMSPFGELMVGREDGLMVARGRFENTGLPQSADRTGDRQGPVRDLVLNHRNEMVVGREGRIEIFSDGELRPFFELPTGDIEPSLRQLLVDREGSLWVASTVGLFRLDGEETEPIVNLSLNFAADGRAKRGAPRYVLPPETLTLTFDISAPTFLNPDSVNVRARLEGHEEAWRAPAGPITYENLPAGAYRLVAEASLDGETWPIRSVVDVEIQPHLHQTLSFWLWIGGALGAIFGLIGGWVWFNRRRERLFAEMAAQEWREIQEESGLVDVDGNPMDFDP